VSPPAEVCDALDAARHGAADWPPKARINSTAPSEFAGREVRILDRHPERNGGLFHVELADEPPCTAMNVPAEALDLEATAEGASV